MSLEIRGTTTVNRGALLMLMAIRDRFDDVDLSVAPGRDNYEIRSRLGLRQTLHHHRIPRLSNLVGNTVPDTIRKRFGLVADDDISGVLDASGFAYSDSFTVERSRREALHGRAWRRRGVPRVLLPQAFGPFGNPDVRRWASEVILESAAVYARDEVSRLYVEKLGVRQDVKIAPDITIAFEAEGDGLGTRGGYGLIVPNGKLVEKGNVPMAAYVRTLTDFARAIERRGLTPIYLVHETTDATIASVAAESRHAIVDNENPRVLKAVIRDADLVVASRFHAAVSSLSQSVPTITLGWSHKYGELMNQFGVPEWSLDSTADASVKIDALREQSVDIRRLLAGRKTALVADVNRMWEDVRNILKPASPK